MVAPIRAMSKTRHPLRKICVRFYPRPCKHYFEPLSEQNRSLIGKWWHQLERGPKGATCCKKCVFVFNHDLVDTLSNHIRSKTGTRNKRELPTALSWRNSKKTVSVFLPWELGPAMSLIEHICQLVGNTGQQSWQQLSRVDNIFEADPFV